jgi:hypothetical protein
MLPADAAADAAAAAALNLLLAAPSRDAIALVFSAAFRHRHDAGALLGAPAVRALSLPPDDAARLAAAAAGVLRRVLYESSELLSADAVAAALPPALDAGLRKYLATVRRGGARASHPPPPPQFLFSALPGWREGAIESRVALPRLEAVSWRVDTAAGSAELASAAEPLLRLALGVRAAPRDARAPPPLEELALTVPPAALGALVDGMRRVRDQLAALHAQ